MTNEVFESILQSMKEALAHARGEITLPEREYPGTLIPTYQVLEAEPEQQKMALEYAPEAESEQHGPPKAKVVGSTPTGDSNTEDDDGL